VFGHPFSSGSILVYIQEALFGIVIAMVLLWLDISYEIQEDIEMSTVMLILYFQYFVSYAWLSRLLETWRFNFSRKLRSINRIVSNHLDQ
jgi:hypothetical protein